MYIFYTKINDVCNMILSEILSGTYYNNLSPWDLVVVYDAICCINRKNKVVCLNFPKIIKKFELAWLGVVGCLFIPWASRYLYLFYSPL